MLKCTQRQGYCVMLPTDTHEEGRWDFQRQVQYVRLVLLEVLITPIVFMTQHGNNAVDCSALNYRQYSCAYDW